MDISQVERHGRLPIGHAGIRSLDSLIDQSMTVGMAMVTSMDSQDLLNEEADTVSIELAVLIVYLDVTLGDLIGQEDILCEYRAHRARALVNAAPSLDIASFGLCISYNHVNWLLTDDQYLLVFHVIMVIIADHCCLDIVLHFGLGLLSRMLMLEGKGGG